MTDPGDSTHEMRLSGDRPAHDLSDQLLAAKRALVQRPSAEAAAAHMSAIAEEARLLAEAPLVTPRPSPSRPFTLGKALRTMKRVAISLAVAAVAGMTSMAGLAFAGVNLPSPAVTAFQKIGITLPNQATTNPSSQSPSSDHGQAVKTAAQDDTTQGCEHGQAVADVASSNNEGSHADAHRQDAAHRADPCAQGGGADDESTTTDTESGDNGNSPGYGKDNHPTGKSETAGSNATENPTGNGKDSHPSDAASGRDTSPTGYGKDVHPTDSTTGMATNPTGHGHS